MGDLDPELTLSVNRDASIELAKTLAKRAGVGRYLFSGSCSVYGKGEKLDLEETDPLNPLTAYAAEQDRHRSAKVSNSRTTASRPPTSATRPPTATRPCCGSTWW